MTLNECNPGRECEKDNKVECCRTCLYKRSKSLDEVNTECIFVEKVFDARLFKKEIQERVGFVLTIDPPIESIETFNVECKVISVNTMIDELSINGFGIDISTTIPGPGGEQVALNQEEIKNIVDTKICMEESKGTKVRLNQRITINVSLEITGRGKGINSNGQVVNFIGSEPDTLSIEPVLSDEICISPLSPFPISMITSCLADCTYALLDFTLFNPTTIFIMGSIIYCTTCETKLKVPTQICALTADSCRINKDAH